MNRRNMLVKMGMSAVAVLAFPKKLFALSAPEQTTSPCAPPAGRAEDKLAALNPEEAIFLNGLRKDFPEYYFWVTPMLIDSGFYPRRGILCRRLPNGNWFKLKGPFPSIEIFQDAAAMRTYNNDTDCIATIYHETRVEIAHELTHRHIGSFSGGAILVAHPNTHPISFPFRLHS
jgi:hypothetical protein